MNNWSEAKVWSDSWNAQHALDGGGQASTKLVKSKSTGETAFLKVLNRQDDTERRARFFREATAYATTNHKRIPNLVQSNAHRHDDRDFKLYIVTDFVDGPTLSKYIGENGAIRFADAVSLLSGLSDAVSCCHANGWVHRDIKPDNIILKSSDFGAPMLLDFGVGYKEGIVNNFEIENSQELGNRFLRLPEMSAGSASKQDPRTDISFLGGILFYVLTEIVPSVLVDENGRMPHQRKDSVERLSDCFAGSPQPLLAFFDQCFAQKLTGRFADIGQMQLSLGRLAALHAKPNATEEKITIEQIAALLDTQVNRELQRNKTLYDLAMNQIQIAHSKIGKAVSPTFVTYQTGYVNFSEGLRNDLGFTHFATHEHRFVLSWHIKIVGEELLVAANDITVYRTELDAPVFSSEFAKTIEELYLKGLMTLTKKTL